MNDEKPLKQANKYFNYENQIIGVESKDNDNPFDLALQ